MKKVINKKVYDTDKAKKIGDWDNGLYGNDINACAEALYRTKSGAYFLHGSGGANTKYATVTGSSWGSGEKIIPLDEDTAKEWAGKHLPAEAFGSAFEHIPKSKCVSAILKADQLEKLDRLRRETGKTISAIISDAVDQL